jgi:hypothetical protein
MTYELLRLFQLAKLVKDDAPNPRESWGTFLTSVCHEVPSGRFRDFQMASFQLCMSYLPDSLVQDPTPVPPPLSMTQRPAIPNLAPQVSQQQQQQYSGFTPPSTTPQVWIQPIQPMQPPHPQVSQQVTGYRGSPVTLQPTVTLQPNVTLQPPTSTDDGTSYTVSIS